MKNHNRISFRLFLSLLIIFTVLSISAYTIIIKKESHAKNYRVNLPPKENSNGGPIRFTTNLDNDYYFDNDHVYLYIDLRADAVDASRERAPLNIAIVIDKSGSMSEKHKLDYVKRAVDYIIEQLGGNDYVSVVTFNDDVDILQRSAIVRNKFDLREMVSGIKAGGYTNLSEGMFEGYDQVNNSYSRGYVNRVLLLTDGLANRGITDRFELADKVRNKNRRDGITISTFGVGNDFNENLLTDIADYGRGNYYYIQNSSDIPGIFAQELKGVRDLVGQATRLRVKFPSEYLSLNKVFGYPYEISGNEVYIDFKDVFAEQTKSVLIKFDIRRRIDSRINFESELTYEDVGSNFKEIDLNDSKYLEPATSKEEYQKGSNEVVTQNISVFESNDMLENALREADNGNYDRARIIVKDAQTYMSGQMNQVAPSPGMRKQSEAIDKYNDDLKSAETKSGDEKKEMQKSGKYDNYNSRK
jgi:Ca-activated chloride channel family protein